MKRTYILFLFCFSFLGCIGNSTSSPKLEFNVESINFCDRALDSTTLWNNLQLRNPGKGALTISSLAIRGDESCAFTCEFPNPGGGDKLITCPNEDDAASLPPFMIAAGATLLVRIGYTPSAVFEGDSAALIVASDAFNLLKGEEKTAVTEIAMCGFGAPADPVTADGGMSLDAGIPADGGPDTEDDCPACPDLPEKGAPSCADRP